MDLNAEEKMGIETALPRDIRERVDQKARELQLLRPQGQGPSVEVGKQAERSFLHRLIAHTMLQFFLFLNFLLPYVKLFLGSLYQYERRHRVSERVFSAGVNGVDVMGKRGLDMSNAICGLNDGKVGDSINGLFVWWIRGVTGGIHEGVGEGLNIMNRRKVEQSEAEAGDRDRVREL